MGEPRNLDGVIGREAAFLRNGKSIEAILVDLRADGLSVIDCIRIVMALQGCSAGEAKRTVQHSTAWADRREADEAFQEDLIRALEDRDL